MHGARLCERLQDLLCGRFLSRYTGRAIKRGTMRVSRCWWGVAGAGLLLWGLAARPQEAGGPTYTLKAQSNLALLDVVAVDHNSLVPDRTLTQADFVLLDDGKPVPIASLDRDSAAAMRPLLLWVIVQCRMPDWQEEGSGFMGGTAEPLAKGLTHLHANEKVAVAHWCDDGHFAVDLHPTLDHGAVIPTTGKAMLTKLNSGRELREGEIALQKMLRLTQEVSRNEAPGFMPVLLFLHGDKTGAPPREIDKLLVETLESNAVLFLLNDGALMGWSLPPDIPERSHVLRFLSEQTGGAAMAVQSGTGDRDGYSEALAAILDRLHGRYQIGFVPQKLDGKVHSLKVELTPEAKQMHHGLSLMAHSSYRAPLAEGRTVRAR